MRKSQAATCDCKAEDIIFLPCAGGSNCGQITNQVAFKLDEAGVGRLYCLAGISTHIAGMVESARSAKRIVALDGCQTACARKAIEHVGLHVTDWVCVTEKGIDKKHQLKFTQDEVSLIACCTKDSLSKPIQMKREPS